MDNSNAVTPDKVKNLLSSFLVPDKLKEKEQTHEDKNKERDTESIVNIKVSSNTSVLRSYDSFVERLETFSTWFGKSADLSPLICARYGWENVDTDMLQCVGCKTFLSGQLPNKADQSAYEDSHNKLKKNLIASHDKFCVLAANPCPEHFCNVPLDNPSFLITEFTTRVKALIQIQERLPCLDLNRLQNFDYDEGQGGAYCKRHLLPDCETVPQAITLAFTGWTFNALKKDVIQCNMCLRHVGLWNYLPLSHSSYSSQNNDEDIEPCLKKRKTLSVFDPLEDHHHWCPWVQTINLPASTPATSNGQSTTSLVPACIAAIKIIAPGLIDNNIGLASAMKTSPMVEGMRCFRRVIKSWSTKKKISSPQAN